MQVGSLVTCIKTNINPSLHGAAVPELGEIYTITHMFEAVRDGTLLLNLAEFEPVFNQGYPMGYDADHFREIQPPMSIPESLFNQSPEKITV